jgi:hypothetical protein
MIKGISMKTLNIKTTDKKLVDFMKCQESKFAESTIGKNKIAIDLMVSKFVSDNNQNKERKRFKMIKTYKITCNQCDILVINNTPCHETGCPNAKKGYFKNGVWFSTEEEESEEDYYLPDDGYADGGEPYTEEELEIINKK